MTTIDVTYCTRQRSTEETEVSGYMAEEAKLLETYYEPCIDEPLKNSEILFHNQPTPLYHTMENPDEKFGILRLKVEPKPEGTNATSQKIAMIFTIDTSASMTDYCTDNRRKLDHAVQTLIGIMQYLADAVAADVTVAVLTFSTTVKRILDFTRISHENLSEITRILERIRAQDSTNIEAALKEADLALVEYGAKNPDTKLYHIQLTDGEVTDGEKDHDRLAELVNPDYTNIFVGFGKYHDDRLLSKLSENPRNDYRFIDKLEFSKVVYGEILYNILYHRYDEVEIEVHGAQIYNWRTNQWGSRLMLSNIPYDCERMFQLRADATSDPPSSVEAFVWTTPSQIHGGPSKIYCYPELMDIESNEREVRDLTRYSFRQRTQELLYEVRECIKRQNNTEDSIDSFSDSLFTPSLEVETTEPNSEKNEKRVIYEKCREFMRTIKEYMDANNAKDDRSLRLLQDDIYIVLKTLYRRNAHMWCATRHISLGREHSYQPTQGFDAGEDFDATMPYTPRPKLRRNGRPQLFYTTQDPPVYTFPLFDHPLNTPDITGNNEHYEMSQNFDRTMMSPSMARTIDAVVGDTPISEPTVPVEPPLSIRPPAVGGTAPQSLRDCPPL